MNTCYIGYYTVFYNRLSNNIYQKNSVKLEWHGDKNQKPIQAIVIVFRNFS